MRLYVLLAIILFPLALSAQSLPKLIPYEYEGKYGYADTNGRMIISPQWDYAGLFAGDKAIVRQTDTVTRAAIYCIIDSKGNYIIPPSRRWNGLYNQRDIVNAKDENGHPILIDTNNHIIRPYTGFFVYGTLPDTSYKIVTHANGGRGIINSRNEVTVPCAYETIFTQESLTELRAVIVRDSANPKKPNMYGVVTYDNEVLLPPQYHDIYYVDSKYGKGFSVSRAINNDDKNTQYKYEYLFIVLKTGKKIKTDHLIYADEYQKIPGGHMLLRDAGTAILMDSNKKVLWKNRDIRTVTKDTITLVSYKRVADKDSVIETTTYLNTQTRKAYGLPTKKVIYSKYKVTLPSFVSGVCGNGARAIAKARMRDAQRPTIIWQNQQVKDFYRDSVSFRTSHYACSFPNRFEEYDGHTYSSIGIALAYPSTSSNDARTAPIVVNGNSSNYGEKYTAVVDNKGNYIVKPLTNVFITDFNLRDSLVTVKKNNESYVVTIKGDTLTYTPGKKLAGAMKWKGELYTYVIDTEKWIGNEELLYDDLGTLVRTIKLGDEKGNYLPNLKQYELVTIWENDDTLTALVFKDTMDRLGIITPDGHPLYPDINFKYKQLQVIHNGWVLARDSFSAPYKLLYANGKEICPGMPVEFVKYVSKYPAITSANTTVQPSHYRDDLYIIGYKYEQKKIREAYIDKYGRLYSSEYVPAPQPKQKAEKRRNKLKT